MITILEERTVVSHPALNAYHPSLVCRDPLNWMVTHDLGSSFDALDYHTRATTTADGGRTWNDIGRLIPAGDETTHTIRTRNLRDGRLIGFGKLEERHGYATRCNRETLGQAPMRLFWISSDDFGRHWSEPCFIAPPFQGPTWELCHPIIELTGGRWGAPVATWSDWDGRLPNGHQTGILISEDCGISWPGYGRMFDGRETGFIHWEQSVITMEDGTVLSAAWAFDPKTGKTFPNVFARSLDAGHTFSSPQPTGFFAQTCKLLPWGANRVAAAYRRHDEPGLWLEIAEIRDASWKRLERVPLWKGATSGMQAGGNAAENLGSLSFGYPSMAKVGDDTFVLVYWRQEGKRCAIQSITIRIDG